MSPSIPSSKAPYVSRIVAATKRIHLFDQCDPVTEMVSDAIPVIAALINTASMTVITATGRSVKIWDLLTGKELRKYSNLTKTDTTAICLDDRQRKFLLGDHSGNIHVFNYSSGAFMKPLDSHSAEVSRLLYCARHKNVLSVSWDRAIVLHSELDPLHGVKIREMDSLFAHAGDITAADLDLDSARARIMTGSLDKTVRFWDYFSGKLINKLRCEADITAVLFLHGSSASAAADHSGRLHVWAAGAEPSRVHSTFEDPPLTHHEYLHERLGANCKPDELSSVLAMAWDAQGRRLVVGDEYGSLSALRVHVGGAGAGAAARTETAFTPVWRLPSAHDDGITSIDINHEFNLVITAGFDCCVRAFSLDGGVRWGVLVNGAGRGVPRSKFWNVPFSADALALAQGDAGDAGERATGVDDEDEDVDGKAGEEVETGYRNAPSLARSVRGDPHKSPEPWSESKLASARHLKPGSGKSAGSNAETKDDSDAEEEFTLARKPDGDSANGKPEWRRKLVHKLVSLF
jgi:hypothetical protein